MSRRNDRKHAFNLIFQIEFRNVLSEFENSDKFIELYYNTIPEEKQSALDKSFVKREFCGVLNNLDDIDKHIKTHSAGWTLPRIAKTDLAILRLCIYELIFETDIPASVSINEAVELAKTFSTDDSPAFINGVIGRINKDLQNLNKTN